MRNPFTESWHRQMDGQGGRPESRRMAVAVNGEDAGEVWVTPFVLGRGATLGDLRGALPRVHDGCDHVLLEALDPARAGDELRSFYVLLSAPGFALPAVPGPFALQSYVQLDLGERTFVATTHAPRMGGPDRRIHPRPSHPVGARIVHGDVSVLECLTTPRATPSRTDGTLDLRGLLALVEAPATDSIA